MANNAPVETAQRHQKEMSQRQENDEDGKGTEEMLKSLDLMGFSWKYSHHGDIEKNKTDFKNCGLKFGKLTGVSCSDDPGWILYVLQKLAPHLQVLHVCQVGREHLQAVVRMPRLRELAVMGRDRQEPHPRSFAEIRVPPSGSAGGGLRKLRIGCLPWPIVVTLLKAHRLTLQELMLWPPYGPYQWRELAAPLRITLPSLRKLSVVFLVRQESLSVDEWEAVNSSTNEKFADLLAAVRLSLEELVLEVARWEHLEMIQDLPQLRKLEITVFDVDPAELVNQANAEDQDDAAVHVDLPAKREECEQKAGLPGLRTYWGHFEYCDISYGQPTQRVLAAHSRTLEEVSLEFIITPQHLRTIQRMPRLRTLRLKGCPRVEPLTVAVVKVDESVLCQGLKSLTTDNISNATVIALLSLYAQSLEEVGLLNVTREQLRVAIALPKLQRLQLHVSWDDQIDQTDLLVVLSCEERQAMRLERLEANDLPAETLLSLLAASRDTLQEVEMCSAVSPEVLLQLQRMPALRNLHVQCFTDDLDDPGRSPLRDRFNSNSLAFWGGRRRFDVETTDSVVSGLPSKQAPDGGPGLRQLHIFASSAPPKLISCLLALHCRTLEDVCLVEATRDQLLVTLRLPVLRRLQVHDVRWDLDKATRRDVPVGKCRVEWMRISESPSEVARWLLLAHRHALRHVELHVENEQQRYQQRRWRRQQQQQQQQEQQQKQQQQQQQQQPEEGDTLWPSGFRNLHRLLEHCELKRLETLVLLRSRCESPLDGGRCRQQLDALRRVLPGRVVRCSQCDDVEGYDTQ